MLLSIYFLYTDVNAQSNSVAYKQINTNTSETRFQQQGTAMLQLNILPIGNTNVNGKLITADLTTATSSQTQTGQTGKCPEEPYPYNIYTTTTTKTQSLSKTFS